MSASNAFTSDLLPAREEIHDAAREGRYAKVEELLAADPKLANKRDADDRLPLHWALSFNHFSIVELFASQKGFDPDAVDGSGWTPLMIACSIPDGEKLAKLLLSKGADVNAKNNASQTALHFCVSKQNVGLARMLLEPPYKASARIRDRRQQLPLHRAAAVGSSPLITLLLDHLSPINATDLDGATALHHAVSEGHGEAAMTLLKRGADSGVKDREEKLAIEGAPDRKVGQFILGAAKEEGIEIVAPEGMKLE